MGNWFEPRKKLLTADEIDQSVTMIRGMNRFVGEKLLICRCRWSTIRNREYHSYFNGDTVPFTDFLHL